MIGNAASGLLTGASTGASIGSIIPGLGTLAGGIIGGGIGLLGGLFSGNTSSKQYEREKELMGLQYQYNEKAADANQKRALEMWEATNYAAQVEQMKKAGLNVGLMYGRGGGSAVSTNGGNNSGVSGQGTQSGTLALQEKMLGIQMMNTAADTTLKLAQAKKEAGEAEKKTPEKALLEKELEIKNISLELQNQQKEINANTIVEGAAKAQEAIYNCQIVATDAEIKKETKETVIAQTLQELINMQVSAFESITKSKLNQKQTEYVEEQIRYYFFDLMTGRISADAASKNAETMVTKVLGELELGKGKLSVEEERLLKDWIIQGTQTLGKAGKDILKILPVGKFLKFLK